MTQYKKIAKITENMKKAINYLIQHSKDILITQCHIKSMTLTNRFYKKWKKLLQILWKQDLCSSIQKEIKD